MQTFSDFDTAIRARDKWTQHLVLIDGRVTPCTDLSTQHGTDAAVASATLVIEAPLPAYVRENVRVEVQAGYPGAMATIFSGMVPSMESVLTIDGKWATLEARGWADLLTDPAPTVLEWTGPIALKEIVRSILALCRVPYSLVDDITYDDGSPIELGVNSLVNEGKVTISPSTGLLSWLTQTLALFGYALFDTPSGVVRVQRVSGLPVGTPVLEVEEGTLGYEYRRRRTTDGMATYWRVTGAQYTDADGVQQTIASIPETVPLRWELAPRGYRKGERGSDILATVAMADAARNVLERDYGAPITPVTWRTDLAPHIQPGDIATVTSPTVGAVGDLWITGVAHHIAAGQMKTTTFDGIRGNGSALPAGQDCISLTLLDTPRHLGDEHIPWYAVPSPSGRSIRIGFTVPDTYTSLKITYLGHGANTYILETDNTESSVSRFVIWQNGEEASSGNLMVMTEDYSQQLPYGPDRRHWARGVVLMPGSLRPGPAELEIVAGEDDRLPSSTRVDDFEIDMVVLTACGAGIPIFIELEGVS